MRIRKNKKLSTAANPDEHLLPTHFCQLNQSPWDVIPFHHHTQFGMNDNGFATRTGCSLLDPVGPVDSCDEKQIVGLGDEFCKIDGELSGPAPRIECAKTDGKFWKCKREAKEGHHFCEHHILQLKSYSSGNGGTGPGRERAARKKKKGDSYSSSSVSGGGSSEYYYYSGFGPWWRKNRGDRLEHESPASHSGKDGTGYGQLESEPDDDEEGDKKRVRKPIKARSLKSLM